MSEMTYLDHNATTPIRPEAAEAVVRALQVTGNPSSVHGAGRAARRLVEDARATVAALVGTKPANVVFTSGATESNNLALSAAGPLARLLISAIEHDSVRQFRPDAEIIPVTGDGVVDCAALEAMLIAGDGRPRIVSVMGVNNETGVAQPLAEVIRIAREAGALVHCDAVQMAGKFPIQFDQDGPDLLSLSSHKIGGPRGVGALVVNPKLQLPPAIRGGGQEKNRRAGTENVSGIAGFGAAAEQAQAGLDSWANIRDLRDRMEDRLVQAIPGLRVAGKAVERAPGTSCLALAGRVAETQVMAMDLAGIAISAGSACSSGKVKRSHVLDAMGYDEDLAAGGIRVSLGWNSTSADVEKFIEAYTRFAGKAQAAE